MSRSQMGVWSLYAKNSFTWKNNSGVGSCYGDRVCAGLGT